MSAVATDPTAAPISPTRRPSARALLGAGGPTNGWAVNALLGGAAVLMVLSALIHLHLWASGGYRSIPTIGPLFLLQAITGFVLAGLVVAVRRLWAVLVALGFVVSTVAGFLWSTWFGLFGFKDTWSASYAATAFGVEVAASVLLAIGGGLCLLRSVPGRRAGSPAGPPPG